MKLHSKLRAVEIEIDAVASRLEPSNDGNREYVHGDDAGVDDAGDDRLTLQQALTADRLRSLKKTRAQVQKEIDSLKKDAPIKILSQSKLLSKLVKGESNRKRRRNVEPSKTSATKQPKAIAFDEDADFEAQLDAASGGFLETVNSIHLILVFNYSLIHCFARFNKGKGATDTQRRLDSFPSAQRL